MNPMSALTPAACTLAALVLGGCYYTSPYGYAPYYAPAPVAYTQAPVTSGNPTPPPEAMTTDEAVPVYAGPVYPAYPPYPYYYPPYYPGWYDCCWPPVAIGFGFGFGGGRHFHGHGHGGGHFGRPPMGGHFGGGHGH
ncbi:hypothetical protein [Burkholderia sp. Ac-20353]|uniref:hypothetical protein n=1 Tax=Burkholderia sp. Ac-20353 TaxID=2703894 RepID=UPI00197BA5B8|nr:hypothetical protein [Burkholderia sp. Ac-20353]MBN3793079.1 hypothetical protein [Burkholderia sp. Ac-20353]